MGSLQEKAWSSSSWRCPLALDTVSNNKLPGRSSLAVSSWKLLPKFIRPQRNSIKLSWLPQQLDTSEDVFRTPRELGMAPGQLLLMQDGMRPLKSRRMKFDLGFLTDSTRNGRQDLLPIYEEMCRPTFVLEMFLRTGQHSYPMNESLVLHPVEPLSLRVDWQAIMHSPKAQGYDRRRIFPVPSHLRL